MCQSKAKGGKRCAYHSKIKAEKTSKTDNIKNKEIENDLKANGVFTCALCKEQAIRGSIAHRCLAKNLVPLTNATDLVIQTIINAGGKPLIVGGSVRDAILSKGESHVPKDIDIEVYGLNVDTLIKALKPIGKVGDVGKAFN